MTAMHLQRDCASTDGMREVRGKKTRGRERTREKTAAKRQPKVWKKEGWVVITSDKHCFRTQRSNYDLYQGFMALWVWIISEHQSYITWPQRPVKIQPLQNKSPLNDKTHHLHNTKSSVTSNLILICCFCLYSSAFWDGERTATERVFSTLETIKWGGLPCPHKIHRLIIKFLLCGADH